MSAKLSAAEYRQLVQEKNWKPRNCVWELTLACNLRCLHCGSRAGQARRDELSTARCLNVVEQLADAGCELVTLSGGEPTLRPDWQTIARAISNRGLHVNMVTNGVYSGRHDAREIAGQAKDAGLCNVGISIDGPPEIHEQIRGQGTFARTVAAVEQFVAAGLQVGVMTTVNGWNLEHLREVRQIALDAGASMWRLQLAKPMGAMADQRRFVLQPRQLLQLLPELVALKKQGGLQLRIGDSLGYYGAPDKALRARGWRGRQESWQGCQAGMQAIGIEADGGVKGCLSLQARLGGCDPFREGSLAEASLEELWQRPGGFAYNRELELEALTGLCHGCRYAALCRGGARCISAAAAGVLTEDPYCFYGLSAAGGRARPSLLQPLAAAAASMILSLSVGACGEDKPVPGKDAGQLTDAHGDTRTGQRDSQSGGDRDGAPAREASAAFDAGAAPDTLDCASICCECEYGIIPPAIYEACCAPEEPNCENVCCDCDYGAPPPPECCP